jgi:hypothetical protein
MLDCKARNGKNGEHFKPIFWETNKQKLLRKLMVATAVTTRSMLQIDKAESENEPKRPWPRILCQHNGHVEYHPFVKPGEAVTKTSCMPVHRNSTFSKQKVDLWVSLH